MKQLKVNMGCITCTLHVLLLRLDSSGISLIILKSYDLFVQNMEYILYISYPIVGQLTLTSVSGNVFSWSVAPFFCIIFG